MLRTPLSKLFDGPGEATFDVVVDNAKSHAKFKGDLNDSKSTYLGDDDEDNTSIALEDTETWFDSLSISTRSEASGQHHSLPDLTSRLHRSFPDRGHNSDSVLATQDDDRTKWIPTSSPSSLRNASKPVRRMSNGSTSPPHPDAAT